MVLDPQKILNWPFQPVEQTYTERDTILYALGCGLGADPLDEDQLPFVFEEPELRALPSMAAVLSPPGFWARHPDAGIDWVRILHGEQAMEIHKPLRAAAKVVAIAKVTDIVDKGAGRGALLLVERTVREVKSGEALATLRSTTFARGDGGCGGTTETAPPPHALPDRDPDLVCDLPTALNAALIYRLSGDPNPLHASPSVARAAGFERPILHGLCSWGVAGHAILKSYCDYDPARLTSMALRFSAPVYPGETIRTEMWRDGDTVSFRARVAERDVVVLNNGRATISARSTVPSGGIVAGGRSGRETPLAIRAGLGLNGGMARHRLSHGADNEEGAMKEKFETAGWQGWNRMRCAALAAMGIGLGIGLGLGAGAGAAQADTITVSVWGGGYGAMWKKHAAAPFEKATGHKVVVDGGRSAVRLSKLIATKGKGTDIVFLTDYQMAIAREKGLISKIDPANVPNVSQLYDFAKDPLGGGTCPAITVIGVGLAYNKSHFKAPPTSWHDLFRKGLKGRPGYPNITQSYSPLVLTRIAELHGGGIDDIGKGFAQLATIKDKVQIFRLFEILQAINQGDASIAPMLNIFVKKDPKVPLSFAWPKDGGIGIVNLACVVKGSKNKAVAEQFLNFYLSAEHQANIAKAGGDSPVNKTVPVPTDTKYNMVTPDQVSKLHLYDSSKIAAKRAAWLKRFQEEIVAK